MDDDDDFDPPNWFEKYFPASASNLDNRDDGSDIENEISHNKRASFFVSATDIHPFSSDYIKNSPDHEKTTHRVVNFNKTLDTNTSFLSFNSQAIDTSTDPQLSYNSTIPGFRYTFSQPIASIQPNSFLSFLFGSSLPQSFISTSQHPNIHQYYQYHKLFSRIDRESEQYAADDDDHDDEDDPLSSLTLKQIDFIMGLDRNEDCSCTSVSSTADHHANTSPVVITMNPNDQPGNPNNPNTTSLSTTIPNKTFIDVDVDNNESDRGCAQTHSLVSNTTAPKSDTTTTTEQWFYTNPLWSAFKRQKHINRPQISPSHSSCLSHSHCPHPLDVNINTRINTSPPHSHFRSNSNSLLHCQNYHTEHQYKQRTTITKPPPLLLTSTLDATHHTLYCDHFFSIIKSTPLSLSSYEFKNPSSSTICQYNEGESGSRSNHPVDALVFSLLPCCTPFTFHTILLHIYQLISTQLPFDTPQSCQNTQAILKSIFIIVQTSLARICFSTLSTHVQSHSSQHISIYQSMSMNLIPVLPLPLPLPLHLLSNTVTVANTPIEIDRNDRESSCSYTGVYHCNTQSPHHLSLDKTEAISICDSFFPSFRLASLPTPLPPPLPIPLPLHGQHQSQLISLLPTPTPTPASSHINNIHSFDQLTPSSNTSTILPIQDPIEKAITTLTTSFHIRFPTSTTALSIPSIENYLDTLATCQQFEIISSRIQRDTTGLL